VSQSSLGFPNFLRTSCQSGTLIILDWPLPVHPHHFPLSTLITFSAQQFDQGICGGTGGAGGEGEGFGAGEVADAADSDGEGGKAF
jgi:hypothetical protein